MTTLEEAADVGRDEHRLAVVSTVRADLTVQSSVVNAGVLDHPATGEPVLAFVTYGPVKLAHLRARPQLTATFRSGWQWATVEGRAELAGPDDPQPWLAAGGEHQDWAEYDRVMAEQRRTVVLVRPERIYGS
jgi:PPOX class probable F420-dependent enzyme